MKSYQWYQKLEKPTWAPPAWLFGPVWTVLYAIIAVTFGTVVYLYTEGQITFVILLPFILNLIFNFLFTPIQFKLRNNYLALLDIFLVLGTLIWLLIVIHPIVSWVTYANIPYVLWVSFATILQATITYLNR